MCVTIQITLRSNQYDFETMHSKHVQKGSREIILFLFITFIFLFSSFSLFSFAVFVLYTVLWIILLKSVLKSIISGGQETLIGL